MAITPISQLSQDLRALAADIDSQANQDGRIGDADKATIQQRLVIVDKGSAAYMKLVTLMQIAESGIGGAQPVPPSAGGTTSKTQLQQLRAVLEMGDKLQNDRASLDAKKGDMNAARQPYLDAVTAAERQLKDAGWYGDKKKAAQVNLGQKKAELAQYDAGQSGNNSDWQTKSDKLDRDISANGRARESLVDALIGPQVAPLATKRDAYTATKTSSEREYATMDSNKQQLRIDNSAYWETFWTSPQTKYNNLVNAVGEVSDALSRAHRAIESSPAKGDLQDVRNSLPPFLTWNQVMKTAGLSTEQQLSADYYVPASVTQALADIRALESERDTLRRDARTLRDAASTEVDPARKSQLIAQAEVKEAKADTAQARIDSKRTAIDADTAKAQAQADQARTRLRSAIEGITAQVMDAADDGMTVIASNRTKLNTTITALQNDIDALRSQLMTAARRA